MAQVIWFELNRWKAVFLFFFIFIFCVLNVSLYQSLRERFDSVSDSQQEHANTGTGNAHNVRSRQILYKNSMSKYRVIHAENDKESRQRGDSKKKQSFDPKLEESPLSNLGIGIKVVHHEMKNGRLIIDPDNLQGKELGLSFSYNGNGSRIVKNRSHNHNRYLHRGRTIIADDKDLPITTAVIQGLEGCVIQNFSAEYLKNSAPSSSSLLSVQNQKIDKLDMLLMKKPKLEIDLTPDCLKPKKTKAEAQVSKPARFMIDSKWNLIRVLSHSKLSNDKNHNHNGTVQQNHFNDSANDLHSLHVSANKKEPEKQMDLEIKKLEDKKDFWKENVCYYRSFEKNPPSKMKHENYLSEFNNKKSYRYGPMIKIVHDKTPLPKTIGFIETFCHSNGWLPKTVYENYWTRVISKPELKIQKKEKQNNQDADRDKGQQKSSTTVKTAPLNILIIGLASLSRATFIREMPLSFSYLTNNLSAIEFPGFNTLETAGSESDPMATNLIPLLTGLNYREFRQKWPKLINEVKTRSVNQGKSSQHQQKDDDDEDSEKLKGTPIWTKMAELGYRTSFSEDFVKSPCPSSSPFSSSSSSPSLKFFSRLPPDNSISSKKYPRLLHETIPDYLLEKNPLHHDFTVMANQLSRYLEDKFDAAECDCKKNRGKPSSMTADQDQNQNQDHDQQDEHEDEHKIANNSPLNLKTEKSTAKPLQLTVKSARMIKAKKNAICWGYRLAFDVLMENLRETMQTFTENSKAEKEQNHQGQDHPPKFWHMTWSSSLTRRAPSKYAKYGDKILYETLKELKEKGILENTALLLVSDHGGSFDSSTERSKPAGQNQNQEKSASNPNQNKDKFLESRLPMLYIALPKNLEKDPKYEMALKNLRMNAARRLVTPFDLYPTLVDLTDLERIGEQRIIQRVEQNIQRKLKQPPKNSGKMNGIKSARSSSLFLPISKERSCADVEIKPILCTCANLNRVNLNLHPDKNSMPIPVVDSKSNVQQNLKRGREDPNLNRVLINKMAHKVVQWINHKIHPYKKCHQLQLRNINQAQILQPSNFSVAKLMNKTGKENSGSAKYRDGAMLYELDIATSPRGNFYASVYYNPNPKSNDQVDISFRILDVIRIRPENKSPADQSQNQRKEIFNLVTSDAECVATLNIQHLCICKKREGENTRMRMRRSGDFLESIIKQILPN